MADMPSENPNKYGRFDDDTDELAARLSGREFKRNQPHGHEPAVPDERPVDEDFFREARDSVSKYGR